MMINYELAFVGLFGFVYRKREASSTTLDIIRGMQLSKTYPY